MMIGSCGVWGDDKIVKVKEYGCDCFEPPLFLVAGSGFDSLKRTREICDEAGIRCVSLNGMLTGDMPLLGGRDCYGPLENYLKDAFAKASILGGKIVVLGCGAQRRIPEGMSKETAEERFCDVLREIVLPAAKEYGITIALEELRKEECNFINSAKEAADIVKRVGDGALKLHIDYFHTILGGGTLDEIAGYGSSIAHVHLSSLKHFREFPKADDIDEMKALKAALDRAGYDGAATFEGVIPGDFFETLKEAVAAVRSAGFN
ncbi:MAG: sugar phosphate isomerase/epimerase [Clostridia bacterium]|nr:sugar phosphate isomerase/epimerase [Clostridia bacterium]